MPASPLVCQRVRLQRPVLDRVAPIAEAGRAAQGPNLDGVLDARRQPVEEDVPTVAGIDAGQPRRPAVRTGPAFVHFCVLDGIDLAE